MGKYKQKQKRRRLRPPVKQKLQGLFLIGLALICLHMDTGADGAAFFMLLMGAALTFGEVEKFQQRRKKWNL